MNPLPPDWHLSFLNNLEVMIKFARNSPSDGTGIKASVIETLESVHKAFSLAVEGPNLLSLTTLRSQNTKVSFAVGKRVGHVAGIWNVYACTFVDPISCFVLQGTIEGDGNHYAESTIRDEKGAPIFR